MPVTYLVHNTTKNLYHANDTFLEAASSGMKKKWNK